MTLSMFVCLCIFVERARSFVHGDSNTIRSTIDGMWNKLRENEYCKAYFTFDARITTEMYKNPNIHMHSLTITITHTHSKYGKLLLIHAAGLDTTECISLSLSIQRIHCCYVNENKIISEKRNSREKNVYAHAYAETGRDEWTNTK